MKIRLLAIGVILLVALAGISYSYADNDHVFFIDCAVSDNETVKDIGEVSASINDAQDILTVEVECAYPGYTAFVEFSFQYITSDPEPETCYIKEVTIQPNTFPTDLIEIVVSDNSDPPQSLEGLQMDPDDIIDGLLTINILETAENEEQQTYPFYIDIVVETVPPPVPP